MSNLVKSTHGNLIPRNEALLSLLTDSDRQLVDIIIYSERLSQMGKERAKKTIAAIVIQTEREAGVKDIQLDIVDFLTERIYTDVCTRWKMLTDKELRLIAEEGVRGNLGKWFGISVTTFNGWIKEWTEGERRIRAINAFNKAQDALLNKTYTKEEELKIISNGYDLAKKNYKETKEIPLFATTYWEEHKRRYGNNLSKDEMGELYMRAEEMYRDELRKHQKLDEDYTPPSKKSECFIFKRVLHGLALRKVWSD